MRKRFGRRNFKQRFFRLTTQSLSYAKAKGKRAICDIPLTDILGVERLSEDSFKMQNVFQVNKIPYAYKYFDTDVSDSSVNLVSRYFPDFQ